MRKTKVHVVNEQINIEIKNEKTITLILNPDEALDLGIILLKTAYSMRNLKN